MSQDADLTTARIVDGDRRAAARLMTQAENGEPAAAPVLSRLHAHGGRARILGVTGAPGSGKSTLVDRLVTELRQAGQKVAVLAVDPSSPFSGGAVLGDRVRMGRHAEDDGVLIRSMSARGSLGGLAPATGDLLTILDAIGFDVIIVETVGVGQSEIDILSHADVVLLLQTANGGDGVQMVKAGVLEIADIFVVNKSDLAGSDRVTKWLKSLAAHGAARADEWTPAVVSTQADEGIGVGAVTGAVDRFFEHRAGRPAVDRDRRRRQVTARVLAVATGLLRRRLLIGDDAAFRADLEAVLDRQTSPQAVAAQWIGQAFDPARAPAPD